MTPLQRRFLHRRDLLPESENVFIPVALRIEPGKCPLECRVFPAPRKPARVMDNAQAAQGFNQIQFASVEGAKLLVTVQQRLELWLLFGTFAGKKHPQILDRRSTAAVVEVHDVKPVFGDEYVAGMKVAVQSQDLILTTAPGAMLHALCQLIDELFVIRRQFGRDKAFVQQKLAGLVQVTVDVHARAVLEIVVLADQVCPRYQSAELFEHVEIVQLRRSSAAAWKHGETKIIDMQQCFTTH